MRSCQLYSDLAICVMDMTRLTELKNGELVRTIASLVFLPFTNSLLF